MRGDDPQLDDLAHKPSPPARLLDVTRLLRRAGRVWTGVDRVELAYLDALVAEDVPVFGLARTPLGYVLLDRGGLVGFRARLDGTLPPSAPIFCRACSAGCVIVRVGR